MNLEVAYSCRIVFLSNFIEDYTLKGVISIRGLVNFLQINFNIGI